MSKVIVVDYDPNWPLMFDTIRAGMFPALEGVALTVEHVGGTAVPGVPAKPVIDIDVVVRDRDVRQGIESLQSIGYLHRGDRGVPKREAFHSPEGLIRHHLYLCPVSSPALWNHLAIRNHLRSNASDARAYGELKRRLATSFTNDSEGYVQAKTDFLVAILRRCGADDRTLHGIALMNVRT